jgi:hypothetical protein
MQIWALIIAILMTSGAWLGWRRSPLYSRKATFKLIVAVLLIVAAIVGGTIAILQGPVANSPTAQAVLIGLLIIAVGIGATAGIIRITDSHLAQLPPSVRIVNTERHKIQVWIWRIVAYLLISGAAVVVLPSSWSWLPGVPGLLLLLGSGPSLVALYMRARRLDLGMSQVLAAPWAHWRYSAEEWQAWARNQLVWEHGKQGNLDWKRDWWKILKVAGMMAGLFLGGALVMVSGSVVDRLTAAGACMAFLLVVILCVFLATRGAPERRNRRLLAAPPEAVLGDEGVFCEGSFSPWILSGSYLVEATAPRDPPARLELVFRNFNGSSSVLVARRIPIPEGRESDVQAIQEKLSARCPKATVRLR